MYDKRQATSNVNIHCSIAHEARLSLSVEWMHEVNVEDNIVVGFYNLMGYCVAVFTNNYTNSFSTKNDKDRVGDMSDREATLWPAQQ